MVRQSLHLYGLIIIAVATVSVSTGARAEIICAGDIPPRGMVITATGTAPSCDGACRARRIQPVYGEVMKICADQPIPEGYVLDGLTNTPACKCLGDDQNAYIIKRKHRGYGDNYNYSEALIPPQEMEAPSYGPPGVSATAPAGGQVAPYGVGPQAPVGPGVVPSLQPGQQVPANPQQGYTGYLPPQPGYPSSPPVGYYGGYWPGYDTEPMRVGE